MDAADLLVFRARWNARAALCAGLAALTQGVYFFVYFPPSVIHSTP
jgi:hypothetical protein